MIDIVKNYVEQVIYIAIFVLLLEFILPKGNTRKHIVVVISLVVLLNIISPIFDILETKNMKNVLSDVVKTASTSFEKESYSGASDFSKYKNLVVTEEVESKMQEDIKKKINKLNVEVDKISIALNEDYTFKKIKIYVYPIDLFETAKISKVSEIMYMVSDEYGIDTANIEIIEEEKNE